MIRGLSEIRRCPRLGHIRLGIKVTNRQGVTYPKEVNYFIIDPQTGSQQRNEELKEQFKKLYGEKPTAIKIMFPPTEPDIFFQQWYKRYGKGTLLKCKGEGEVAVCGPEFTNGLEVIGKDEMGLAKVVCNGPECIYQKDGSCRRVGAVQILLPDLSGIGVWQINTSSWNSIVNLNSALDWLKGLCGRYFMIPITLRRIPQDIPFKGQRGLHYVMQIDLENVGIGELQRAALVAPEKAMLPRLPEPDETKDELLFPEEVDKTEETTVVQQAQDTLKATVIKEEDIYGDINRFPEKDRNRANRLIQQLKVCEKKLGREKFMQCVGSQGWDNVQQIQTINDLVSLVNLLLAETRDK